MRDVSRTNAPFAEFEACESAVRSYCRDMRAVFARAVNARLWDEDGVEYIDFLSACGSLNYGHNHPALKARLVDYLTRDGVLASLDLHTVAKRDFLRTLRDVVLAPRGLTYRVQFTGPTGTNAVEAALKLARKVTGRRSVVAFTNAFHGMTLGALAVTARESRRRAAGVVLGDVVRLPYEGYLGAGTAELILSVLQPGGVQFVGIDLLRARLRDARRAMREQGVAAELATADAARLPFAPASFDAA